jgi:hypothetical protein
LASDLRRQEAPIAPAERENADEDEEMSGQSDRDIAGEDTEKFAHSVRSNNKGIGMERGRMRGLSIPGNACEFRLDPPW